MYISVFAKSFMYLQLVDDIAKYKTIMPALNNLTLIVLHNWPSASQCSLHPTPAYLQHACSIIK